MNFFWLALGLAVLGYFIGDGLKNFSKPQRKSKYPSAPKIELKGTTYYPYHQFVDWLSSNEIYKV